MILQPSNNALSSSSNYIGQQSSSASKNTNVSSSEIASASFNPSVNVQLSSSKLAASAIPPIYSKPTVYSSNESQLSPSVVTTSSAALAQNAILSNSSESAPGKLKDEKQSEQVQKDQDKKSSDNSTSLELTEDELKMIEELKARDREVRAHEQAHKSVGGQYAGAISFSYQAGPDGKRYAVGGEVPIDVSPISGDPRATIAKMTVVSAAATAPVQPSAQDQVVAAQAGRLISEAQSELAQENNEAIRKPDDEEKAQSESSSSSVSNTVYTNNSLEQFQSVAANDNEKVNLIDALV